MEDRAKKKISKEELERISAFLEEIQYGSVTIVIHDGKIVQIEKNEKLRLN